MVPMKYKKILKNVPTALIYLSECQQEFWLLTEFNLYCLLLTVKIFLTVNYFDIAKD